MTGLKIGLALVFTALWYFLTEYFFMPTFALSASGGIYGNLFFYFAILGCILILDEDALRPVGFMSFAGAVISLAILLFGLIYGAEMFNASEYQRLIGKIEETEFTANVQPISPHQMLVVDEGIARRVGEKEVGSDPGLGSRATVGSFTLQAVNKQLYWIAPLEHSGFWKWNRFDNDGTPGYIKVSATNQDDYALVRKTSENDLHIRYQNGSYFSQDLERHIYTSGYRSILFGEFLFEVDDNWHPYWTVTVYDTKIGFSGEDATGVLTIEPQTGEIKQYSIAEAPAWIDRIQPNSFTYNQVDDWGDYIHGYWNWSGADKKRVASESSMVLGSDGHSYFYYGLTSAGNDNSTVGFVMVDTRTKKAHWFKQAGATESAAKSSAEGKVQEKGYGGSEGVTYNIDGHPTYEFLLKDKGGLMKLIALVNVHDHTIVGIGENRQEALQDYRSQMNNRGNSVPIATSDMEEVVIISKVSRFGSEITKGNTYYSMILEKAPKTQLSAGSGVSSELALTREGDIVRISYIELNSGSIVSLRTFDNLNVGIPKDTLQLKNEARMDTIRTNYMNTKAEGVMDEKINNLTPEEKKKILKTLGK